MVFAIILMLTLCSVLLCTCNDSPFVSTVRDTPPLGRLKAQAILYPGFHVDHEVYARAIFPALATIDLHVYARLCSSIMLCSAEPCALSCEGDGPSDIDWSRWCRLVLGRTLFLSITLYSPEVDAARLQQAVFNRLSFLRSRLQVRVVT